MYSLIDQGGGKWRGGLVESGMAGFMTPPLRLGQPYGRILVGGHALMQWLPQ